MAFGAGKYDDLTTEVRKKAKARGVLLLVFDGERGTGFSAQCDALTLLAMPDILESVAREIRESGGSA